MTKSKIVYILKRIQMHHSHYSHKKILKYLKRKEKRAKFIT